MVKIVYMLIQLFFFGLFGVTALASDQLLLDAEKNNVDLYGPYIKYNFLSKPFSMGLHQFDKRNVGLSAKRKNEVNYLKVFWPKYFLSKGRFELYDQKNKKIASSSFEIGDLEEDNDLYSFVSPFKVDRIKSHLESGVHFCVIQNYQQSKVRLCSDKIRLEQDLFLPLRQDNAVRVLVNGVKVPTNAQINIGDKHKDIDLDIKFRSGLRISIFLPIEHIRISDLSFNLKNRQVYLFKDQNLFKKRSFSFNGTLKKSVHEKNYYLDEINRIKKSTINISDGEFSPHQKGAGIIVYGVNFPEQITTPKNFKLISPIPNATYSRELKIFGEKEKKDLIFASSKEHVEISDDMKNFIWFFQTENAGTFNRDVLGFKSSQASKPLYYTTRIYRSYQGAVSARAAIGGDLDQSTVPSFQFNFEYWLQQILSNHPFFLNRWGVSIGTTRSLNKFFTKEKNDRFSIHFTHLNIMARFARGIRPVDSSLGIGIRYLLPAIISESSGTLVPETIGVGIFWHTAPQKIIDSAVNMFSFFRYPKWMELSAYFYPLSTNSNFAIGNTFSLHARGRLLFSERWFLDTNLGYYSIDFKQNNGIEGVFNMVEGAIGLGYNF